MVDLVAAPPGTLRFAPVYQLPDQWWTGAPASDPAPVWTVWKQSDYYLWGANSGNYKQGPIGSMIGGGGMAGVHGPTLGRMHPHYVGIITMDVLTMPLNDPVFTGLGDLIAAGSDVVVPVFRDTKISATGHKFALGTGIGATQSNWGGIQSAVLSGILALGKLSGSVDMGSDTYWPDMRQTSPKLYPLTSLADIATIVDTVLASS